MIFYKKNKGFTLLELLVVVGIIGLLTALVLVSTTATRNKGADAGIKSNIHTIQNQSAIVFSSNNSFGTPYIGGGTGDRCPSSIVAAGTSMFSDPVIFQALTKAVSSAGAPPLVDEYWCFNNATVWAVSISLKTNPAYSWCADSSGKARQVNATPELSINSSTHLCN